MTETQREALRRHLEPERLRELFNLQGSVYASRGGGFEGEIYGPFHALRESGPVHEGAPGPLVGYDGPAFFQGLPEPPTARISQRSTTRRATSSCATRSASSPPTSNPDHRQR